MWLAWTFEKVYEVTEPTDAPSTTTPVIWYPVAGAIEKVSFEPEGTLTDPEGEMDPPVPAEAVMV